MAWYWAALGAAVVWGIHYPLVEFTLQRLSLVGVLVLTGLPVLVVAAVFPRMLVADVRQLARLDPGERWTILALALTSVLATVLLFVSIEQKNATLAGLIEISYPLFIVLFTWLLFRQLHLNAGSLAGGILIVIGAILVIVSSR